MRLIMNEDELERLILPIVDGFRADPRNKVVVPKEVILAGYRYCTGQHLTRDKARQLLVGSTLELNEDELEELDAITFICERIAERCLRDDPDDEDEEARYTIEIGEGVDDELVAEIRPR